MGTEYSESLAGEAETIEFGKRLARATFLDPDQKIPDNESAGCPTLGGVIYLLGDLGAGKTTLSRGILRGFGHQGAVKSPTYTLVEPYSFDHCNIYHFDLYRLGDPEEVSYLGTDDYFVEPNLCLVEWADRGRGRIPAPDLTLVLSGTGTAREIHCQTHSDKGERMAKRLWA